MRYRSWLLLARKIDMKCLSILELEYLEVLGSIVSFREMSWARIGEFLYKEEAEELLERKVGRTSPLGCRRSYKVDSSALLPFLALSVEMCHLNLNSLLFLVSSEMAAGLKSSFYC